MSRKSNRRKNQRQDDTCMHTCMTHGISYVDLLTFVRLTLVIHRAIEKELDLPVESTVIRLA